MIATPTIGGLALTKANGIILGNTDGFAFPEIRVEVDNTGNFSGARLGLYNYGRRGLSIEGIILGSSRSDYESKRRALQNALSFDDDQGLKTLTVVTEGGITVTIDVIILSLDMPYLKGNAVFSPFKIELVAPYPYFEGAEEETIILPGSGGGFAIPFAIPFSLAAGQTSSYSVTNDGNSPAYPVIVIRGGIANPSVRNETTDKSLAITYTLSGSTDTITLDFYNRTVFYNETTNILRYVSGDWWSLEPGANHLRLLGTDPSATAQATVTAKDTFIGL